MAQPLETLAWEDVKIVAESLFDIWLGQPEMAWAKRAWEMISEAGLSSYSDECERHRVLIRLLTLAILFHEFWYMAAQETFDRDDIMMRWEEASDVSHLWIGFLAGKEGAELNTDFEQQDLYQALDHLAECRRREIVRALLKGFGNEEALFASLWCSNNEQLADETCDEQEEEAFWELGQSSIGQGMVDFADQGPAYTWVDEGMYRI